MEILSLEPDSIIMSYNLRDFPLLDVNDAVKESDITVAAYPNPFGQSLNVSLNGEQIVGQRWTITVIDLTGRKLGSQSGIIEASKQQIDLSQLAQSLSQGIYIMQVQIGSQVQSMRIVKE